MKIRSFAASAALISAVAITAPASAQVAGIGTINRIGVIANSTALTAGYRQIETTYAASIDIVTTRSGEVETLRKQLDADKDNDVSDAEIAAAQKANNPAIKTIQEKQAEIEKLIAPIQAAQLFVVDGVAKQYETALKTISTQKKINVVLSPDAIEWAPAGLDIGKLVMDELNRVAPSVSTTAPESFSVSRSVYALYEQIGQVRQIQALRAAQAAQAQQQQGAAPAPGTAPAGTPPAAQPAPQTEESR